MILIIIFIQKKSILKLGILEPIKLKLKRIIQEIWNIKITWDEKLPIFIAKEIDDTIKNKTKLSEINIPRLLTQTKPSMINIFSDASLHGYGYIAFLTLNNNNNVFIKAKTRITPLTL